MTENAVSEHAVPGPPALRADDPRVRSALLEILLDRGVSSAVASALLATVVAWVLSPVLARGTLLVWLAWMWVVPLLRARLTGRFGALGGGSAVGSGWHRAFVVTVALNGLGWAAVPLLAFPVASDALRATLLVVICGVMAGGVSALAPDRVCVRIYAVALTPPLCLQLLAHGGDTGAVVAAAVVVYTALLVRLAAQSRDTLASSIAMAHANAGLVERLRRAREEAEALNDELRQARDQALASLRARDEFCAIMSHELRTPLNGVLGTASLLRATPLDQRQSRMVEVVETSGRNLLALIDDILELAKMEAGHLALTMQPFDLRAETEAVCELFRANAEGKGIALTADIDPQLPPAVMGDAMRLRQVMSNLVGNAIKFTEKGRVRVACRRLPDEREGQVVVSIEVHDSGIGMTPEVLGRIFDRFVQADGSTSRRFGGTGLGLAICQHLVRAMGGEITVRSMPEVGSCFGFRLELAEVAAPSTGSVGAAVAPASLHGRRVLVAEDNPVNAILVRDMLELLGCEVETVADGEAAVRATRDGDHDLVLMDWHMPALDGAAATRAIREHEARHRGRRVPIVALTANALAGDRETCIAAGMDDYLTKPIDLDALRALLVRVVPTPTPTPTPSAEPALRASA
ncbi:MAG: response regulator [Chromatiales bacterium]|nr:response regulator [Chromatiales bacterium]